MITSSQFGYAIRRDDVEHYDPKTGLLVLNEAAMGRFLAAVMVEADERGVVLVPVSNGDRTPEDRGYNVRPCRGHFHATNPAGDDLISPHFETEEAAWCWLYKEHLHDETVPESQ